MSVTELGSHEREFERTPPHDLAAEQSVLGGMLLSANAIAEVVEILRPSDFYRPAHQILFDTILELYGRGEPADAVTVVAELTRRGEINRVGGAPYLHTLMATVPTAANAAYYAKIVRERAVLRKLVEVGTRIVQLGYSSDGADADEILDRAQAEVLAIADNRSGEDYLPLSEIMPGALDEIEAIGSRGGQMTGVPTGFADLDALTNGLHPGQMIIIAARPAIGKALALDTPLPTPDGWTTMGRVKVGDYLLGADGKPTRVVAATEVMTGRPCYEVEFSDGEVIVADAWHQWLTVARDDRTAAAERSAAGRGACALGAREDAHRGLPAALRRAPERRPAAALGLGPHRGVVRVPVRAGGRHGRAEAELVLMDEAHLWFPAPGAVFSRCVSALTRDELRHGRRAPGRVSRSSVRRGGSVAIRTTEEIARTLRDAQGRPNHAVTVAAPFDLPHADLPLDPYRLGVLLSRRHAGDRTRPGSREPFAPDGRTDLPGSRPGRRGDAGSVPGVSERPLGRDRAEEDIPAARLRAAERRRRALPASAPEACSGGGLVGFGRREPGLPGACPERRENAADPGASTRPFEKDWVEEGRIPAAYLRAAERQRRALLAGLLAGAPEAGSGDGLARFTTANRPLAEDVRELVISLGHRAALHSRGEGAALRHVVSFAPAAAEPGGPRRPQVRRIVDVRPVPSVPVRCVQVDNADHMYLAGRSCVPTHNSTLALDFARAASIKHGLTSAFFSLEMGRNEITMRLLSAEARVALHAMRSGTMQDEDWTRLARRMSEVAEAPLFIDDSPNMTMMEIRAKCRRLKQQHDLRLVIIDYLQLMTSNKRVESRQVEVSEFSRSLKLLAKELQVPVVALSQLNRGPEQRTDKKPMISDLRESGSIEQDADVVILLHREDAYEKESPRAGEADLIVAKHRNGPTATVTVAFQGHYSRFVDMAQ
ncbi:replicative DNA helicase [Thermomonospora sp. CIF 1]|uniref:replicative DNA helicase n=1 Tax=Thermomonospora sp. CIF 1 TaxID=1916083 RepID=UPI000A67B264|nr:replicative DNA helicase [Thermomonospora sp. CIF 1]